MPEQPATLKEASQWATQYLKRDISISNISYLVQYGKIKKFQKSGSSLIDLRELKKYYRSFNGRRELNYKNKLGDDLNWALSFDNLREKDTTKHVHRLHPYKGKFIPQLVEYFIDRHVDDFKKNAYFKRGDIILDPFSGSGTTLVQANELGIHSIGMDISRFNCMISEVKLQDYDFDSLAVAIKRVTDAISVFEVDTNVAKFERELLFELNKFNYKNFPSPSFKYDVNNGKINENKYSRAKDKEFLKIYTRLIKKYGIRLKQNSSKTFLDKWYIYNVREEIDYALSLIKKIRDIRNKEVMAIILSRAIRSCRATTHSDLATLKEPQIATYYCFKHKKICKPLFSIKYWFLRYANDTINRLNEYNNLKKGARYVIIPYDSRTANIDKEARRRNGGLYTILKKQKIKGIFTSPPYVGQIDYHEQHAYAYDLFGFHRKDNLEIGPLYQGQGAEARKSYVEGISKVFLNCRKYLAKDSNIFIVANDKYNLYPTIANNAGLKIVNKFKRPVLNRTERDKAPYSEIIFHLKNYGSNNKKSS